MFFGPQAAGMTRAAAVDCPAGWFCLYNNSGFGGFLGKFSDTCCWQHLSAFLINDITSSIKNKRANDSFLSEHIDGNDNPGGWIRCFDSNTDYPYIGDAYNDEASG